MKGAKTRSMTFGCASLATGVALLGLSLPAKGGSISVVTEHKVYGPGYVDQTVYGYASGVYSLAKGEQLVSMTVSWQWESWSPHRTWLATGTYHPQDLHTAGVWEARSGTWWPPQQQWVDQFQVTLNYKDATGKLKSVSSPWVWLN